MFQSKKIRSIVTSFAVLTAFSACGTSGVTGVGVQEAQIPQNDTPVLNPDPIDNGSGYPALPFSFSVYGQQPTTATSEILTDNMLKVKIKADSATRNQGTPQYTNFAAEYNCAVYKVTLQMQTGSGWTSVSSVVTNPLTVPNTGGCANSQAEQTIDFSGFMTAGHGKVRIAVEAVKTDFYCILYNKCVNFVRSYGYWSYDCYWAAQVNMTQYTCPLKTVYQYHTVNGNLEVQINGSVL